MNYEYVTVRSRRGHFNLCDPSQESISTYITILTAPENRVKKSCNITTDYEITDPYPDIEMLISEISSDIKRYIIDTAREKKLRFSQYLRDNHDPLSRGNLRHELEELLIKKEKLLTREDQIHKNLSNLGYFENGRWIE